MSPKMEQAYNDLPIEHVASESALYRERELMYWIGKSGETYHYNTLKALMIRGLLQFIPNDYAKLIKREEKHNNKGYNNWNKKFLI